MYMHILTCVVHVHVYVEVVVNSTFIDHLVLTTCLLQCTSDELKCIAILQYSIANQLYLGHLLNARLV